jgi:excisionase family DNA binding protein
LIKGRKAVNHRDAYGTVEIARMLGVSPTTAVNWIRAGRMPAYRTPGGHRRVKRDDLLKFVRDNGFPMPPDLDNKTLRVLVIDDDPGVREMLAEAFVELSPPDEVEVATAADGTTGLIEVGRFKPQVLVLDILLPGIDGFEVLRRLKQNETISPRVLAISGSRDPEIGPTAIRSGAEKFFPKPLDPMELVEAARAGRPGGGE